MITNIWSKFDLLQTYLAWIPSLSNLFIWWITAWKPIEVWNNLSLYFWLSRNSPLVTNDRDWNNNLVKRATLEFVITTNQKNIANVVIYEALDILSNALVGQWIALTWMSISSVQEWIQSGIIYDTNANPLLIAEYDFTYKSIY